VNLEPSLACAHPAVLLFPDVINETSPNHWATGKSFLSIVHLCKLCILILCMAHLDCQRHHSTKPCLHSILRCRTTSRCLGSEQGVLLHELQLKSLPHPNRHAQQQGITQRPVWPRPPTSLKFITWSCSACVDRLPRLLIVQSAPGSVPAPVVVKGPRGRLGGLSPAGHGLPDRGAGHSLVVYTATNWQPTIACGANRVARSDQ